MTNRKPSTELFRWLMSGLTVCPPALAARVQLELEREAEIIRARRAAELGAVVLADGGMVPAGEAALIDGRWVRIPAWAKPADTQRGGQ